MIFSTRCLSLLLLTSSVLTFVSAGASGAGLSYFPDHPALIDDVRASGTDVEVELTWTGDAASLPAESWLTVRDEDGGMVASSFVLPVGGGGVLEVVPGALGQVTSRGLQYAAALEDAEGKRLSDTMPFRVELVCDAENACTFEAIPGVDTESVRWLDPSLAAVLDQIALDGGTDDLWSEVNAWIGGDMSPSFTFQLDLEVQHGPNGGLWLNGECQCFWTAHGRFFGEPAPRGFGHLISAYANPVVPTDSGAGWTEISMDLRCYQRVAQVKGTTLSLPGGQTFTANGSVLTECDAPCRTTVDQKVDYLGWTWVHGDPGTTGHAENKFEYFVEGVRIDMGSMESDKTSVMVPGDHDRLEYDRMRPGQDSKLSTTSDVWVGGVLVGSNSVRSSARGQFDMITIGRSSCSEIPEGRAELSSRQAALCCPAETELMGGEEDDNDGTSG